MSAKWSRKLRYQSAGDCCGLEAFLDGSQITVRSGGWSDLVL